MMLELKLRNSGLVREKGKGKHSKGIRYFGVSGKGKQIRPQMTKQKVAPPLTMAAQKDNQWNVSTAGIC